MAEMVQKISLEGLTIKVKLPRALPLRMWIAARLVLAAGWVMGCGVEVELKGDEDRVFS